MYATTTLKTTLICEDNMKLPFKIDLNNKTAVVTGGGGVLCSIFAKALAQCGASVAVLDLRVEAAQAVFAQVAAEIKAEYAGTDPDSEFIFKPYECAEGECCGGDECKYVPESDAIRFVRAIIACPDGKAGPKSVLNTTVNAEMWGETNFVPVSGGITVGGADSNGDDVGNYSTKYNVWVYKPAEAYSGAASLTITLG